MKNDRQPCSSMCQYVSKNNVMNNESSPEVIIPAILSPFNMKVTSEMQKAQRKAEWVLKKHWFIDKLWFFVCDLGNKISCNS